MEHRLQGATREVKSQGRWIWKSFLRGIMVTLMAMIAMNLEINSSFAVHFGGGIKAFLMAWM